MKILWFSNTPANGTEILKEYGFRGGWLSSLDRALNGRVNLSVAFYYARYTEPFQHKGVTYFPISKKKWRLNAIKKSLLDEFIDQEDLPIYLDIVNKIKPDIIHIHGTENPFGCLIGKTNLPVVVSYQGSCSVYNYKYFSGIEQKYSSQRNASLFSPYSWVFSKSYSQRYKYSSRFRESELRNLRFCKNIIGRTDWDRRITRILAPESRYFHNDEVLREPFYQNVWGKPHQKKISIHSTIGDALFKGFETICQSIHLLNKLNIEIEWRVGGISKDSLLNKVVKRKLKGDYPTKGLIILGNLNEWELINNMLSADIYVMPSHIENSPNSLCEAMILGMPCITTLAGGTPSLLKDKEEGLVIQDGDPWSMAGAIMELHHSPEKAIVYGQKARERALGRHNPDKIINDLLTIYQEIANKRN